MTVTGSASDFRGILSRLRSNSDEREKCEESRRGFLTALALGAEYPNVWTKKLFEELDEAFLTAYQSSSGYYQANILDRWLDLVVLRKRGFFKGGLISQLLVFHVMFRGYRREFQRISRHERDRGFGRIVLADSGKLTQHVFQAVVEGSIPIPKRTSDLSVTGARILSELDGLVRLTEQQNLAEDVLVVRAQKSCEAIQILFVELCQYLDVPEAAGEESVTWFTELSCSCRRYRGIGLPDRPEFLNAEAILLTIPKNNELSALMDEKRRPLMSLVGRMPLMDPQNSPSPGDCSMDADSPTVDPSIFGTLSPTYQAFLRDLPILLERYPDCFAAYNESGRLDLDQDSFALRTRMKKAGVRHEVFFIEPQGVPVGDPNW
jgi:hypothetical protein